MRRVPMLVAWLTMAAATACTDLGTTSAYDYGSAPSVPGSPRLGAAQGMSGGQLALLRGGPAVPAGFRAVAQNGGLDRPGGLAVDDMGGVAVIEGGNRLTRLGPAGGRDLIAEGAAGTVYTGVAVASGQYFVTATGGPEGGRVLRFDRDGRETLLIKGLPSGDHPVQAPAVGPDGLLYFGVGAVTDAGVVDKDAPWRAATPRLHDVPCQDIRLTGRVFGQDGARTGAFEPYGTANAAGEVVAGHVPCTSAILRIGEDDGTVLLVAWGFADPRSLAFTSDGKLYALDGNFQGNGIRTVAPGGELVFPVTPGRWYGWPDRHGSRPEPPPLLAVQPNPPPNPLAEFAPWTRVASMDISRAALFGGAGQAYLAVAVPEHGYKVVRMDLSNGRVADFAEFPDGARPVALRFSPSGDVLYVLERGGLLWRIGRDIPVT